MTSKDVTRLTEAFLEGCNRICEALDDGRSQCVSHSFPIEPGEENVLLGIAKSLYSIAEVMERQQNARDRAEHE